MSRFVIVGCVIATVCGVGCAKEAPPAPVAAAPACVASPAGAGSAAANVPGAAAVGSASAAVAVAPPVVIAGPVPGRAMVPVVSLGAGGAAGAGNPMAVVIVMLPGATDGQPAGGPGAPGAAPPHKYKLSLTADTETATVEVDGQPMGATRVQHVYPQPPERLPGRGGLASPVARSGGPAFPFVGLAGADDLPVRPTRNRATATTMRPRDLAPSEAAPSANGAPIID